MNHGIYISHTGKEASDKLVKPLNTYHMLGISGDERRNQLGFQYLETKREIYAFRNRRAYIKIR